MRGLSLLLRFFASRRQLPKMYEDYVQLLRESTEALGRNMTEISPFSAPPLPSAIQVERLIARHRNENGQFSLGRINNGS